MTGEKVIINIGVTVQFNFIVNAGEVINNGTIELDNVFIINSGQFTNNGTIVFENGSTLNNLSGTFTNTGTIDIYNESLLQNLSGTITNTNPCTVNIDNVSYIDNLVGSTFINLGTINNFGSFASCTPIDNVSENPIIPVPPGSSCADDGNPNTWDTSDENCNCIHKDLSALVYFNGINFKNALQGTFTPDICDIGIIRGTLELAEPNIACDELSNNFEGNIAVIDRGSCNFTNKVMYAESAGASAIIICNNQPGGGRFLMIGDANLVNIPSLMVSYEDCQELKLYAGSQILLVSQACGMPIPNLSQWGVIILSIFIFIIGIVVIRQRRFMIG